MKKLKFRHLLQMIKIMKTPTTEAAVNMRNYNMIENKKMNIIINLFRRRLKYEKHAVIQKHCLVTNFWILLFKKIYMLVFRISLHWRMYMATRVNTKFITMWNE